MISFWSKTQISSGDIKIHSTLLLWSLLSGISPEPGQQLRAVYRSVEREPWQHVGGHGASGQPTQRDRRPKWLQARWLGREGQDSRPRGCEARWLVTIVSILVYRMTHKLRLELMSENVQLFSVWLSVWTTPSTIDRQKTLPCSFCESSVLSILFIGLCLCS